MVFGLKVTHNAQDVIRKLDRYGKYVRSALEKVIGDTINEWKARADFIIETIIYDAYTPRTYVRGRDRGQPGIDQAVKVDHVSNKIGALYIDKELTPDIGISKYGKGYAAYFLRGDGFLRFISDELKIDTVPLRDFMGDDEADELRWVGMTSELFIEKYNKIFEDAAMIAGK